MIGPGEMGDLIVEQLRRAGLGGLTVAHPSARRAALIARRYDGHHITMADLPAGLVRADIVVGALGAGRPAVTADAMAEALKTRRRRPVLLIDVAVPADIDPAIDRLEDAFCYELDDLEKAAMQGRSTARRGGGAAWALIDEAISGFLGRRRCSVRRCLRSWRCDSVSRRSARRCWPKSRPMRKQPRGF